MMSASISDPFLLSSYALPLRSAQLSSSKQAPGNPHHVVVASRCASTSDKPDNFISLAVQGDGVHVLDLTTLHPAISHTLGPRTTFSCPPASRMSGRGGSQMCTTYVVIDSSPDVQEEDRGRAIWWWAESLSDGIMSANTQGKKRSTVFPHCLAHVYAPEDLPDRLLLVGTAGQLAVTDPDLNIQTSLSAFEGDSAIPLRHFLFPCQSSTLVPAQTSPSDGVVSVSILRQGSSILASIAVVDTEGHIRSLGSCDVSLEQTDIADVSFSAKGCLTVLTRSGRWSSYRLSISPSSAISISPLSPPLSLASLSFLSSSGNHAAAHSSEISLLALTSSHVLLASMTLTQPEMILLLWDTQYGVLLAEQRFPCPSHLHRGKERGVRMDLVAHGSADEPSRALLVLHPADAKSPEGQYARAASVLVVPVIVPKTSTIANALGRAAASQPWLRPDPDSPQRHKSAHLTLDLSGLEPEQVQTLKAMLEAQEKGRTEEVEKQWSGYVKSAHGVEPCLGHLFAKQLLDVLFLVPSPGRDAAPTASTAYARNVVKYLLERNAVSDAMVDGGLIPALMARKDWNNAVLALSTVIDLPESATMSLLAKTVAHQRQSAPDAMQVDAPSSPPAVPAVLARCVAYSASPGPLRVALRAHLPDAADVVCVLEVLDGWLERWTAGELTHVPEGVKTDGQAPVIAEGAEPEVPPPDKILAFIQAILDSSFLALLSHPPAHALLRTLLARLEPELALVAELQSLNGPLQAFASAHSRASGTGQGRAKGAGDSQAEWHKRRKAQAEHREMNVGSYQVEELVI